MAKPAGVPERLGGHLMPSGEVAPLSASSTAGTGEKHQFQYPEEECEDVQVVIATDNAAAAEAASKTLKTIADAAIEAKDSFTIGVSGGSAIDVLTKLSEMKDIEEAWWTKWHVFFVDERCVPLDSELSNFK